MLDSKIRGSRATLWASSLTAAVVALSLIGAGSAHAQGEATAAAETRDPPVAAAAKEPPAGVTLKDGSRLFGEVVDLGGGKLKVKTASAGDVAVDIAEVTEMYSRLELRLQLKDPDNKDGKIVSGTIESFDGETIQFKDSKSGETSALALTALNAINPPEKKPVIYRGNVGATVTINDGNTQTKAAGLSGEFIMRALKRHRLTLGGAYNYAEDTGTKIAQNWFTAAKYDFFVTDRFYLLANGRLEGDAIQQLHMRTVGGGGLGYQFIDDGDFEAEWANKLELNFELGASYFIEDYYGQIFDKRYPAARWALNIDWPIFPGQFVVFHRHEGFPSLEDSEDFYVVTAQGLRVTVWGDFFASFEFHWRYVNQPAGTNKRSDYLYLFALGYAFDSTK